MAYRKHYEHTLDPWKYGEIKTERIRYCRTGVQTDHAKRINTRHYDFLFEVPVFRYVCPRAETHLIFYRIPIRSDEFGAPGWGYCRDCGKPFQFSESFDVEGYKEIPTHLGKKHLTEVGIQQAIDQAIIRNRVADLIWSRSQGESITEAQAQAFADEVGCGSSLVYVVAEALGFGLEQQANDDVVAA